jgi:hypothetical protein
VSQSIPAQLREQVARQSKYRCAYCHMQELIVGILLNVDHIVPRSLGGQSALDNLCLACWDCNLAKGARMNGVDPLTGEVVWLFHPNRQAWGEHFRWTADGRYVIGLTPTGRATVQALRLNRSQLVVSREFWVEMGWHPPQE